MFCYETFRSFMFANKIAGASVAFAIGLASAEFAKSLTLKRSYRSYRGCCSGWVYIGRISAYDFGDVSTMGLYWICMIGVLFYIRIYFWKVPTGTATVLSKDENRR
jgi:hypothetical protein